MWGTPSNRPVLFVRGFSAVTTLLCVLLAQAASAAPATPIGLTPGSTTSPGPTLSGPQVLLTFVSAGATYYDVGVRDLTTNTLVVDSTTTATSMWVDVAAGRSYRWNVSACDSTGCSAFTTPLYFQVRSVTPSIPTGLSPGSTLTPGPLLSSTTVQIGWNAVSGATYYDFGIRDMQTGTLVVDTTTTGTSYTRTLTAGRTYRWNVRACNAANDCSSFTTPLYFLTPGPAPSVPTGLSPGSVSSPGPVLGTTVVQITWNAVSSATWYDFGIRDMQTGMLVVDRATPDTSNVVALTAGRTYQWNVRTCNYNGCSSYSTPRYFQTTVASNVPMPISPGSLSGPGPIVDYAMNFQWSSVPGDVDYYVIIDNADTGDAVDSVMTRETSFDAYLTAATNYRWQVFTCSNGDCAFSPWFYFRTPVSNQPEHHVRSVVVDLSQGVITKNNIGGQDYTLFQLYMSGPQAQFDPVTIQPGDTLQIDVDFLGNQRLHIDSGDVGTLYAKFSGQSSTVPLATIADNVAVVLDPAGDFTETEYESHTICEDPPFCASTYIQGGPITGGPLTGSGSFAGFSTTLSGLSLRGGTGPIVIHGIDVLIAQGNDVSICVSATDCDGDGLLDEWEKHGVVVDGVLLNLPAMGADPNRPDIFVQLDYMIETGSNPHSHEPSLWAINSVVRAFDDAGINLHVDAGPDSRTNRGYLTGSGETWGSLSRSNILDHVEFLGRCNLNRPGDNNYNWTNPWYDPAITSTATYFDNIKTGTVPNSQPARDHFPRERRNIFHYGIFAHNLCPALGSTSGMSRAIPETDFIVSLGQAYNDVGTIMQQSGTLMHELGHNLGLRHGGFEDTGCKPNYLSVMNYSFQLSGLIVNGYDGVLDYSHSVLGTLDESDLNEQHGIPGTVGPTRYGTRWLEATTPATNDTRCNRRDGWATVLDIRQSIDWFGNNDYGLETSVAVDLNGNGLLQILRSFDDWENITYRGGSVAAPGADRQQVDITEDPGLLDMTAEDAAFSAPMYSAGISGVSSVYLLPGKPHTVKYTIINLGENDDVFELTLDDPMAWTGTYTMPGPIQIEAGAHITISVPVEVPSSALAGMRNRLELRVSSTTTGSVLDSRMTDIHASMASVDIKPGNETNSMSIQGDGVLPVAIMGGPSFDVLSVDVSTLSFGPGEAGVAHDTRHDASDENLDGWPDLIVHFRVSETGLKFGDSYACLRGKTIDGQQFGDCEGIVIR